MRFVTCLDRNSHSETRRKFRVKFQDDLCLIPVQLVDRLKDSRKTGSIKNRKVNHRRHVLTEEILDEIGERLEHTPKKSLKRLSQETGVSVSSAQRATKLLKLHIATYCEYTHIHTKRIPF